ncbi:hypothetical protein B5C34_12680 [Pacificimonas flava]|uniref:Glutamine amidotransferase domain-containing protein n=2 Tax=Pacificimonas TaxID=1960290 RepID=A0A219B8Y7_9SPHN|nr:MULTISPECIES: hypothetical protein [Pacificimonas]MBZ6378478.1 hypothetical protein [Pacificimonas aurantium]OWV34228.1 hypothetical protein B5C34_12680 [Pacificimonas flava]
MPNFPSVIPDLSDLVFAPAIPLWLLGVAAALLVAFLVFTLLRAPRHALLRGLAGFVILAILANPAIEHERREAADDIGLLLVDTSGSMAIGERQAQVEAALETLRARGDGIEWQVRRIGAEDREGTRLGTGIEAAVAAAESRRLGAVLVFSDGVSRDSPAARLLPAGVPLHHLVAGTRQPDDRRLVAREVPPFTVAGTSAELVVSVEDSVEGSMPLTIRTSAGYRKETMVRANEEVRLSVPVDRRGELDVALSVPVRSGEATRLNNEQLLSLRGVTERLSVLLVSGRPYPGGRVWRDLFKADPNIDLVHFTILRLPTSFDTTAPQDLALIPFPVEELFQERLSDFDLIIFDRFDLTPLMSPIYFHNIAQRMRAGGGLLVVAGPEFDGRDSLGFTDLAPVLPAQPAGGEYRQDFRPQLSPDGRRHPVTRTLVPAGRDADWGAWGSLAEVTRRGGDMLMTGPGGRPLLLLDREGEGRVGLIASTDIWWWSRSVEGAGPHSELLRRVAHWLMQEPDLDEEQLHVEGGPGELRIDSDSMVPLTGASITGPGGDRQDVSLPESGERTVEVGAAGLYEVAAGQRRRFALVGNIQEFRRIAPDEEALAPAVEASGGGTFWLEDGIPDIRRTDIDDRAAGTDWAGLVRREAGALIAVDTAPLIPAWAALVTLLALLGGAWWRERK